jgi:hypothetical protein
MTDVIIDATSDEESLYGDPTAEHIDGDESLYDGPSEEAKPVESTPKQHKARIDATQILSTVWGGIGQLLEKSGTSFPVGRTLQFQAPVAGSKLDELVRYSWVDNLLVQPLARSANKAEGLGALIAFPVLIGIIEKNPAIGPGLEPFLRQAVMSTLADMGPVLKKKKQDEKKLLASIKDLEEEFPELAQEGADPFAIIMNAIFAPPPGAPEPVPEDG